MAPGETHGLVGPNGAGKTTLLGLLLGLAVPDEGQLDILGANTGGTLSGTDGVSGFVEGPGLYPALTARRNLAALAALHGGGLGMADVDEVLAEVGLSDVADDRVSGFSLGMRQRLGLATALLTRPRLLVLDEPFNGLDPAGKRHMHGVLRRVAGEGTSVLLSSHRMEDLEALCSEVTTGLNVFVEPADSTGKVHYDLVDLVQAAGTLTQKWSYADWVDSAGNGPRDIGCITTDSKNVYFGDRDSLHAYTLRGHLLWSTTTESPTGPYFCTSGSQLTLTSANGVIYAGGEALQRRERIGPVAGHRQRDGAGDRHSCRSPDSRGSPTPEVRLGKRGAADGDYSPSAAPVAVL